MRDLELTISRIVMIFFRITIALVLVTIVHLNLTGDMLASSAGNAAMVVYLFITIAGERLASKAYKDNIKLRGEVEEMMKD
jgi:hypothetical protein